MRDGGMIAFVIENRRVRFDINQIRRGTRGAKAQLQTVERGEIGGKIESGEPAMRNFRDIPIKQKLVIIIMVTTAAALLLAGFGIVVADSLLFRGYLRRDLSALAGSSPTTAPRRWPLTIRIPRRETLGALRARPHVVGACIYRHEWHCSRQILAPAPLLPARRPRAGEAHRTGGNELDRVATHSSERPAASAR